MAANSNLAAKLSACKTEAQCQAVREKYQGLTNENNAALAKAQAQCDSTGDCAERDRLYASGMPKGSKGLSAIPDEGNIDTGTVGATLSGNNAKRVQDLIDRPLSQEVVYVGATKSFDDVGNVHTDPARYVAAIDNREAQDAMALAMAPTLLSPGPEGLVVGWVLATKAGQKIAEVVLVNGQKVWRFLDGTTAKVGSDEAQRLAQARMESVSPVGANGGTAAIEAPLLPGAKTSVGAADEAAGLSTGKTIVVDSKGNALVGDWSPTKTLTSPENAGAHWTKHSSEFPQYSNTGQYVEGAQAFVKNPPAGTLTKVRPNGDTLFFNPATDTFAVQSASGAPRTMFKPDPAKHGYPTNLDYFNAQK